MNLKEYNDSIIKFELHNSNYCGEFFDVMALDLNSKFTTKDNVYFTYSRIAHCFVSNDNGCMVHFYHKYIGMSHEFYYNSILKILKEGSFLYNVDYLINNAYKKAPYIFTLCNWDKDKSNNKIINLIYNWFNTTIMNIIFNRFNNVKSIYKNDGVLQIKSEQI